MITYDFYVGSVNFHPKILLLTTAKISYCIITLHKIIELLVFVELPSIQNCIFGLKIYLS